MNKIDFALDVAKKMLKVVEDIRQLADSIQGVCEVVEVGLNQDGKTEEPKQVAKKPKVTLEKVRGVLADKSQAGYTAEVKAIIQSHGVNRLSEIAEEEYEAVLKEAEELGNE